MASVSAQVKLAVDRSSFAEEVVARSAEAPVVVDFWAAWCAPCRQLGPVLEQEVERLEGQVLLRTLDVDASPEVAQQFGIRGIPAVKAFRDGQVISEFVGAQPASQVRGFLERLLPSKADQLAEQGDESSLRAALEADPSHVGARRRLARILLREGRWSDAAQVAAQAPQDRICDGLGAWAELALSSKDQPSASAASVLEALALDQLVEAMVQGIAGVKVSAGDQRQQLRRVVLYCFEELGPEHPDVAVGRAQLASALY